MSVISTYKVSFFPTTHARYVVCYPTIQEGEQGPKGLMEEIRTRYYKAYNQWRTHAPNAELGVPYPVEIDNGQVLIFLPIKNDYRDGQINDNIIRAVNNLVKLLKEYIPKYRRTDRNQVTMPPILLEQAEGETRRAVTQRSLRWLKRKLQDVKTTVEISVSPWRMMRKPEDVSMYILASAGYYERVNDEATAYRMQVPENTHGTMERKFVTFDSDWDCDTTLGDLGISRDEIEIFYEYERSDTVFVRSLCANPGDIDENGDEVLPKPK